MLCRCASATIFLCVLSYPAFSQEQSAAFPTGWHFELEIGRHLSRESFNDFFGLADWDQKYTIRFGVGKEILPQITATAFTEYRRYGSKTRYGDMFPWLFPRSYSRTEVACYCSLTFLGFLEGGVGGVLQTHEELSSYQPNYDVPVYQYRTEPAAHRVKLFYIAALKYEVPLGAGYYLPINLSMDMFLGHYGVQEPSLRIGVAKDFK